MLRCHVVEDWLENRPSNAAHRSGQQAGPTSAARRPTCGVRPSAISVKVFCLAARRPLFAFVIDVCAARPPKHIPALWTC